MLRFIASFFTSNENSRETIIKKDEYYNNVSPMIGAKFESYSDDEEDDDEDFSVKSLRERKLKKLAEKALLRKISHQSAMDHYAQDHLPLSAIQEKLEEDNLPLNVLQDKLRKENEMSAYTTTRENINFLLYSSKSPKSKKFKSTLASLIAAKAAKIEDNITNITTNDINTTTYYDDDDDRDVDAWDDVIIGRLMNLIDTVGVDSTQENNSTSVERSVKETTQKALEKKSIKEVASEVVKEIMREVENEKSLDLGPIKENSSFPKESIEDTIEKKDKETIVVKSSAASANFLEKNTTAKIENSNNNSNIMKNNVKNDDVITVENDDSIVVENNEMENTKENVQEEETQPESVKIAEELINFGDTINIAEGLLFTDNIEKIKSNRIDLPHFPKTLRRNASDLNRRGSIHSKKSFDNDLSRRSSISSKISISTISGVIMEQNEDHFDDNKYNKYSSKRSSTRKSNKSLQFLRSFWKNNQNSSLINNSEFLSRRDIVEKYYQQAEDVNKTDTKLNYHVNLRQQSIVEETVPYVTTDSDSSDPGYSNFYLAMPNGKWMVRTRTASRKITGTQYVDQEFI